jgi:hypothetical protein
MAQNERNRWSLAELPLGPGDATGGLKYGRIAQPVVEHTACGSAFHRSPVGTRACEFLMKNRRLAASKYGTPRVRVGRLLAEAGLMVKR